MDKYPKDFLERNLHLDRRSYEDVVNLATEYGKPIDSVRLPPCSNFGFSDTQETSRVRGWPMLMFRPERSYESFLYAAPSFCQRVSARIPNIALSQILNTTLREETQFQKKYNTIQSDENKKRRICNVNISYKKHETKTVLSHSLLPVIFLCLSLSHLKERILLLASDPCPF